MLHTARTIVVMNSNTCDVAGLGKLLSRVDDYGSLQSKLWIII